MRKFYLLATMAAVCTVQATAQQSYVTKLENNQVYYLTNDTVAFKEVLVEDDETDEQVKQIQETYWTGKNTEAAYKAVGMMINGTRTAKMNHPFQTRKDYTDPETGFSMPAGFYRGIFIDGGTTTLQGLLANEKDALVGYQNVKAVILYLVPQPSHWNGTTWKPYLADYPTGRVQARYMRLPEAGEDVRGVAISNQAYREVHINMTKHETIVNDETIVDYTTNACNFVRDPEDYRKSTIDQVYKVKFNLDNQKDGAFYESLFASDKKSEYANLVLDDNATEASVDYYFADVTTTRPYKDNAAFSSSATGYDCYDDKWGVKLNWTPETIIQLEIKSRLYLAGYALICATEGATTKYINTCEGENATWKDDAQAYGNYGSSAIENISATATANSRIYDLSGKQNKAIKPGLNISNKKLFFVK